MRPQSNSTGSTKPRPNGHLILAGLLVGVLLTASGYAQSQKRTGHKARSHAVKPAAAEQAAPAPVPEAPKMPVWPANEAPTPPNITWDSQGLHVQATNSSLHQILNEIATLTGTKVTGFGPDERIFGVYGPGPARDVLSQILHGTNYNVLMLGDQGGQGAPREVVLSARNSAPNHAGSPQPQQNAQVDDDVDTEPDERIQPQPPVMQPMPPNGVPGPLHTPQERMQEMQRQQMEMQRQQQQQLQQMQEQQNQQQQ